MFISLISIYILIELYDYHYINFEVKLQNIFFKLININ